MGATLRALRAVVLLCGFHLLSLLLLAALAGVDVAVFTWVHGAAGMKIVAVSVLLAIPVVRGMFMLRTPKGEGPPGIEVTDADEPRLWALVRELAAATGTRAPDRIVLTADVNAAVSEDTRLLGLRPGPRRLYLGVPLLTGLTEARLRGVLAHEYGHYTGGDTRLSALVVRGRVQIARVVEHFHEKADGKVAAERGRQEKASAKRVAKGKEAKEVDTTGAGVTYRMMASIYTLYGKLYLRASLSTARAQEYAADRAAARIAGRDAIASALREIPALSASHDFYLDSYATLGLPVRLMPPRGEFFGGFGRLLAAREEELARLRATLPTAPASPYDSHPPIAERVRRLEALPADGRAAEAGGPALALLTDPEKTLVALEDAVLSDEVLGYPRAAAWQELLDAAMAQGMSDAHTPLHRALAEYTGQPATLPALLEVVDDGRLWRLAERLPLSDEAAAAKGRAFREFVRPQLRSSLRTMVLAEFSTRSLLSWEFSWSRAAAARLTGPVPGSTPDSDPDGGPEAALDAAVDAALADRPDTAPLRALLSPAATPPA
ncbi:M48 family metalloprotease [Streptomyces cellostaticus]|uniref:M48 family metalloprotease n=1 Tax=Streptomyces cellostaticus TaxID=67285 RepID=UPI0020272AD2|nr:M48 family metallopeptidase [Streptomyces cellostaticus]